MSTIILKKSTTIDAPIAKVWDALINPEQIKKYFFGTEAISDWKKGSTLIFKGVWEGKEYIDKGYILELEKEKLLKYNYWSSFSGTEDIPENYAHITYEIVAKDGGTVFTITQDGFKTEEERDRSANNWQQVIDLLQKVVAE